MRRLPQSLTLGPSETLTGYLDRLAYYLDLPLGVVYRSVGLASESGPVRRISGVSLTQEAQARVAHGTGLSVETVRGALLDQFQNTAYSPHPEDDRFGPATWVYPSTSLCCPGCLAGDGYVGSVPGIWQLSWRLVWSFACLHHARLLTARCPACGGLLGGSRKDGGRGFAPFALVADPSLCRYPARGTGWLTEPCAECLTKVRTPSLRRHPRLLRTQETINAALAGAATPSSAGLLPPLVFFSELRSVVALVFHSGTREHLGSLPAAVREAFDDFAAKRAGVQAEKRAFTGGDGRRAPRFKAHGWTPQDPALMAAVLPFCVEVVGAPTTEDTVKRFAPLVDATCAGRPNVPRHLMANYAFDDRLRNAFEECVRPRTKLSYILRAQTTLSKSSLSVSHVPQLFWEDLYETYLADFLPRVRIPTGRQFASASLCLSLGAPGWEAACKMLELSSGPGGLMRCAEIIREAGHRDTYVAALEAAVAAMEERHSRDYQALRSVLTDFAEVPADIWLSVLPEKPRRGLRLTTRRYAAAWLWAELTSGDYRLSPGMRLIVAQPSRARYRASQAQAAYRTWVRKTISEQLAADLRAYGEGLVAGTAVSSAL